MKKPAPKTLEIQAIMDFNKKLEYIKRLGSIFEKVLAVNYELFDFAAEVKNVHLQNQLYTAVYDLGSIIEKNFQEMVLDLTKGVTKEIKNDEFMQLMKQFETKADDGKKTKNNNG